MPYTLEDFKRDYLKELTPQELLEGLSQERLREVLRELSPEQLREVLQGLSAAESPEPKNPGRRGRGKPKR